MSERAKTGIKAIRTEEDYQYMLSLVDGLVDAAPNSPEYEALQIAGDLVWAWEQKNVEILPPDPIEAIKFRLEQMGGSLRDLRPYIGSDARVSEVMTRKRGLTLKMVRALNRHLGIPLQSLVEDHEIKADFDAELDRYPIHEMMKLGWLNGFEDPKAGQEEEALTNLMERGDARNFELVLCRQNANSYANSKTDQYALYSWCLHVRALARDIDAPEYQPTSLSDAFFRELGHLSARADGPVLAIAELKNVGVRVALAKHLRGTFLDGAAMLLGDGSPVIGMTLRHDRLDNFWHCLLHELAHVRLHLSGADRSCFFHDDFDLHGEHSDVEAQADELATIALLPREALAPLGDLTFVSTSDVQGVARRYGVHPAIVAGRIRYLTGNYSKFAKLLGHGVLKDTLAVAR